MDQSKVASTAASYVASASTTVVGGLTLQEFAVWVGICTAIATFLLNWHYQRKADRRAEQFINRK
jgi:Flp pilus assembly protein TadB